MNSSVEGIIVNNCQYAPIYLIQNPGATQANTYVLTSSTVEPPKPVTNNLKTFYENSGNIENGLINNDTGARPNAIKKKESVLIGNNLKLASFLLPKNDNVNKQYVVDNIVLKPNITTATTVTTTSNPVPVNYNQVNTVPKIDIDRKIVRLKEVPIIRHRPEKVLPKIKPKENIPSPTPSKHTSVQLIKLGQTYHSLNQLSNEQIKMVNQALKMFNDPDKTALEPTYDPVTNTKYIYKVVSPKDLTVVAKKKIFIKDKKNHTKIPKRIEEKTAHPKRIEEKTMNPKRVEERTMNPKRLEDKPMKNVTPKEVPIPKEDIEEEVEPEPPAEAKVTRSGRKVKLPKQILPEGSPQKSRKKSGTIVSCFQCSADFGSLYRLQKHYENHPTHIPAKIHSNLFHCLLAIVKSGSEGDKTNIFIQQLEQFIVKLKSLLPCLLKKVDGTGGQSCTINNDISRLLGMNPGKYNIDVEALNCVKDKNGYCIHNPPKTNQFNKDQNKAIQHSLNHDDVGNSENETENCARINSVAKWPTVSKRIWKLKQKTHDINAKKMRLKSESDTLIELGTEDFIFSTEVDNNVNTASIMHENTVSIMHENTASIMHESNVNTSGIIQEDDVTKLLEKTQDCDLNHQPVEEQTNNIVMSEQSKPKNNYVQFHSTHFDIRSSPIKPTSTVFRKFQINPSKMSNYDVQVIRSLEMVNKSHDKCVSMSNSDNKLHVSMPNTDSSLHLPNTDNRLHVSVLNTDDRQHGAPSSSSNSLHITVPSSDSGQNITIPSSNNSMHVSMLNSNNGLHVSMSNLNDRLHVSVPSMSDNKLHVNIPISNNNSHGAEPNSNNSFHIGMQNSDDRLHVSIPSVDNRLHITNPNSNNSLHVDMPNPDNSLHVGLPNSDDRLHVGLPNSDDRLHVGLPNSDERLHVGLPSDDRLHVIMPNSNNGVHVGIPNSTNILRSSANDSSHLSNSDDNLHVTILSSDCIHDLFKDEVDLSCKESDAIDSDLKDWIISTSEKTEDSFRKANSLVEPELLYVRDNDDKSLDSHKIVNHGDDMPSLDASDSRLLSSQGESVLNFLDTLGNDLYPETEIRNNGVDFQLDLFAFHNS